jgi:dihydrofolate reductase
MSPARRAALSSRMPNATHGPTGVSSYTVAPEGGSLRQCSTPPSLANETRQSYGRTSALEREAGGRGMAKAMVFNQISIDGYFTDARGDMSWAHKHNQDPEWKAFAEGNAKGGGAILLFGRITYDMMAAHWPTPQAQQNDPAIAEGINAAEKIVVSKTMERAAWNNTRVLRGDLAAEVRKLKQGAKDIVIMGSGTLVAQLTQARLIDAYQLVVKPIVLGSGRSMFEGVDDRLDLKLTETRPFKNGNVVLSYQRVG